MDVCELDLPARAMSTLKLNQVYYIGDLLKLDGKALLNLQGMGKATARQIVDRLNALGVPHKVDLPE